MPRCLLKILCFARKITSKILWRILEKCFLKKPSFPGSWEKVKKLSLAEFNSLMSKKPYKSDPLYGVIDYTLMNLDYYFYYDFANSIYYGGDCDDAAYAWFEYLKTKDMVKDVYQILCIDGWKIKSMHFFTVAKFTDGYYRLFNYSLHARQFRSLEETCDTFRTEQLTSWGLYKNLKYCVYEKFSK